MPRATKRKLPTALKARGNGAATVDRAAAPAGKGKRQGSIRSSFFRANSVALRSRLQQKLVSSADNICIVEDSDADSDADDATVAKSYEQSGNGDSKQNSSSRPVHRSTFSSSSSSSSSSSPTRTPPPASTEKFSTISRSSEVVESHHFRNAVIGEDEPAKVEGREIAFRAESSSSAANSTKEHGSAGHKDTSGADSEESDECIPGGSGKEAGDKGADDEMVLVHRGPKATCSPIPPCVDVLEEPHVHWHLRQFVKACSFRCILDGDRVLQGMRKSRTCLTTEDTVVLKMPFGHDSYIVCEVLFDLDRPADAPDVVFCGLLKDRVERNASKPHLKDQEAIRQALNLAFRIEDLPCLHNSNWAPVEEFAGATPVSPPKALLLDLMDDVKRCVSRQQARNLRKLSTIIGDCRFLELFEELSREYRDIELVCTITDPSSIQIRVPLFQASRQATFMDLAPSTTVGLIDVMFGYAENETQGGLITVNGSWKPWSGGRSCLENFSRLRQRFDFRDGRRQLVKQLVKVAADTAADGDHGWLKPIDQECDPRIARLVRLQYMSPKAQVSAAAAQGVNADCDVLCEVSLRLPLRAAKKGTVFGAISPAASSDSEAAEQESSKFFHFDVPTEREDSMLTDLMAASASRIWHALLHEIDACLQTES